MNTNINDTRHEINLNKKKKEKNYTHEQQYTIVRKILSKRFYYFCFYILHVAKTTIFINFILDEKTTCRFLKN